MSFPAETIETQPARSSAIRVLIVDDSVVMRRLLTSMLATQNGIEVAGSARDGLDALRQIESLKPDLVTLDFEMPGPNGVEVLRQIRREYPGVRVIMCSSKTANGSSATVDALLAGADDFVTKQNSGHLGPKAYQALKDSLLSCIQRIYNLDTNLNTPPPMSPLSIAATLQPAIAPARAAAAVKPEVLAIGVSTGGPELLARILPDLPADFPLPVFIVQHMPPFFTRLLADRLNKLCSMPVFEAQDGMEVVPGQVLLAPGDFHMRVERTFGGVHVRLDQGERENSCRPAVDALFRSIAEAYGPASLAVVLTGMGEDGLRGARLIKDKGASILAQDEESSVVWGMPGAVVQAGLASAVLPADEMISEVMRRL